MRIFVLGAGGWGTTLSILLHHNGHEVILWEYKKMYARQLNRSRINKYYLPGVKIPHEIRITSSLDYLETKPHLVVLAIPSQFIRSVLKQMRKYDLNDTTFVSVAKGIENETFMTVSQIIKDVIPTIDGSNISVLSGPSHAEEVVNRIPTAVVVASEDENIAKYVQATFINSFFRVYSTTDVLGVELGGAIKNVIAIGAGIIDGAGFGDNTKAAIMTRGIAEVSRLGIKLGANPATFSGLSGMGDLIVTCMSKHSRNRFVGEELGKGKKLNQILKNMKMVAEGVESCKSLYQMALENNVETPIVKSVYNILFLGKDPVKETYKLMAREMKAEHENN
jgi:glycerol-3-phosphate dehydrogenase (NAD(P)+)